MRTWRRPAASGLVAVLLAGLVIHGVALATTTPRIIDNITGAFPGHIQGVQMNAGGNVIAFSTDGGGPGTQPGSTGLLVYAIDTATSQVEQISVDPAGIGHNSTAFAGGISADGRYVAFTDVAAPGFSSHAGAFLRDRVAGITEAVSLPDGGGFLDAWVPQGDVDVSDDGRFVVFSSFATNILPAGQDTNGKADIFLYDRTLDTVTRVSAGPVGESDGDSFMVEISGDGSTIAFISVATNLLGVGGDTNGFADVFVVDRGTLSTERVSVSSGDLAGNNHAYGCELSMTPDGEVIAFQSEASNLVAGDTNFATDVFVRDRLAGTTVRASVGDGGVEGGGVLPAWNPELSADGTKLVFETYASYDPADSPYADIYLRDLVANTTELISRTPAGLAGDGPSGSCNNGPTASISADGEIVAFNSLAGNLAPDGDGGLLDVFVSRPIPTDADGDRIDDEIDTAPANPSTSFSDGTTFGTITSKPASYIVTVTDAALSSQGVRVTVVGTGSLRVKLAMCAAGSRVYLSPGANVVLTCSSVIVDVDPGSTPVEVEIGEPGVAVITVPPGAKAEIDELPGGGFTIENVAGGTVTVVVDGVETEVDPGETLSGNAWDFDGFKAPIDNPDVMNTAKAGRAVPVRWRILDVAGQPVTNLTIAKLTVQSLDCGGAPSVDQVEEYTTGSSGLINQGNGNYQLNWQTPSSYANSCKTLRLDIGDGVLHTALFRFTK